MDINPFDPVFAERGIDELVSRARGYVAWNDEDYVGVIADTFEGLRARSISALQRKAAQSPGIVIMRYSPFAESHHPNGVMPEIRPDSAVDVGRPSRHFHGDVSEDWTIFELLPSVVSGAVCQTQMGGNSRLRFWHLHSDLSAEELAEHMSVWHSGPKDEEHTHVLGVCPSRLAYEHISNDGKKYSNGHKGTNTGEIHSHQKAAKYLFAASQSNLESWDKAHSHEHMSERDRARHIEKYHKPA